MALKFLSGHGSSSGSSSSVKYFDLRLDNDYIVFRGNEDEAASAQLAGSLVLCLTEPLAVSHVQLTLSGILHMSYAFYTLPVVKHSTDCPDGKLLLLPLCQARRMPTGN